MKRLFTVALITAMLSFTGIANAGDVAISHAGMDSGGTAAWVVIKDKVYSCLVGSTAEEDGSHMRQCFLMEMPD